MQEINKKEWIDSITISPILAKQVLRKFLKAQSARQYTQILDEFFIAKADNYDGMPEIKVVLEDWLEYASHQPLDVRRYIEIYFKFMSIEKQNFIMNSFIEAIHVTEHTQSVFVTEFKAQSFRDAANSASKALDDFHHYLEPIDEFNLVSMAITTILGIEDEYRLTLSVENHHSITKEHITSLVVDMQENSVIDDHWKINEDEDKL